MKNIIITIGREYGSGGKYIGEMVARKLNIPFYDKNILVKTYERTGINYSKLEEYDEKKRNDLLNTWNTFNEYGYTEAFGNGIYQELVNDTIKQISKEGPCVILGRNSNNILKDNKKAINIFIYSNDIDFKLKRKMKIEKMSKENALKKMKYIDSQRKKYYEHINKQAIWGDRSGYDYLIDSSILGIDGTVDLIVNLYNEKQKIS